MARRLKTYQTSSGFFDLAIAAPSMKAAAEAWGSRTNLFRQGLAKETHDPAIVAATMAKPGVVLRRPVGSKAAFSEHAGLPEHLPVKRVRERPAKLQTKTKKRKASQVDDRAARTAALAFEREQRRRKVARRKEEAARERERKLGKQKVQKAERALEKAKRQHEAKANELDRLRAALEQRSQEEDQRWQKQKDKLEAALGRARD